MKKTLFRSIISAVLIYTLLLLQCTVKAQGADTNYKIHGAFLYIEHNPDFTGWKPYGEFMQYSCKRCYKTITTQQFIRPDGKKVTLYSSLDCPSSPNGKHEIFAITQDLNNNIIEDKSLGRDSINKSSEQEENPTEKPYDKNKFPNKDNVQGSYEKESKPVEPEPRPPLQFSIDSLIIDDYLSFYYTVKSLTQNTSIQVVVDIDNSSKTNHLYEEKITMVLAPETNYFIYKPGLALKDLIKKGYLINLYCTGATENDVKSYSSDIKDGKRGIFKIFF